MSSIVRAGIFATIIATAIVIVSLATGDDNGWLFAARYTARFSFHLFLFVFVTEQVFAWGEKAKHAGTLAFGVAHFIHLGALTVYNAKAGIMPETIGLIGGGALYAALGALVILYAMQKQWPRFRTATFYAALTLFTLAYAKRIPNPETATLGFYGVTLVAIALGCRLSWKLLNRSNKIQPEAH